MNKKFVALLALTALVGAFGWFFLVRLLKLPDILLAHIICGVILPMIVPAVATIWFILTSLKAFKAKTKLAYYLIAGGIFFYGLIQIGQLLLNIIAIFFPTFALTPFMNNATFVGPYILSVICLYMGVRILAKLLAVSSIWSKWWFAAVCAVVLAGASLLLPATPIPDDPALERSFLIMFAIISAAAALALVAAGITGRIKRVISSSYQPAMKWLAIAIASLALVTLHEVVLKATDLINIWYSANGIDLVAFLLVGILFMKAGQVLKDATLKRPAADSLYVDSVVYAAGLASNMKEIDTTLDDLRIITATLKPGEQLSADQKKTLLGVYKKIEDYLLTKEPLLNLSKPSLRARLTNEFQEELNRSEAPAAAAAPAPVPAAA